MRQQPTYVTPAPPPIMASTQSMEERPTFRGQSDSARLALFLVLAVVGGVALFLLAGWPVWACIVVVFAAFTLAYAIDNMFATGYLHKRLEQGTERLRIEATLAQNTQGDAAQGEQIEQLFDAVLDLQERMAALENRAIIHSRDGAKEIPLTEDLDIAIRRWIADDIFGGGTRPVALHANGQIRGKIPPDLREGATGYRRLAAAGLVSKQGNNYMWVGPTEVLAALDKLQ